MNCSKWGFANEFDFQRGASTIIFGFQMGINSEMCYFYTIFTKCSRGSDSLDLPLSQ
jgi:hypothetical protein